jgi:Ribonuclease G/E
MSGLKLRSNAESKTSQTLHKEIKSVAITWKQIKEKLISSHMGMVYENSVDKVVIVFPQYTLKISTDENHDKLYMEFWKGDRMLSKQPRDVETILDFTRSQVLE